MTIPTTYLSLHDVTSLRAATLTSIDTPLLLTIDGEYGSMQISLYLRVDASRTARIADAINAILKEPETPKIACPIEAAAYKALDDYFPGLHRSLDSLTVKAAE